VIWEWVWRKIVESVEWVGHQVNELVPPVPDWVGSLGGLVGQVGAAVGTLAAWFPVELVAPVLLAVIGTFAAGLAIKGVRIVASFLTLGGGGAG
jgi:hypothetical protein